MMGWLRDLTHTYSAGLWTIALSMALASILAPRQPLAPHLAAVEESI